MTNNHNEPIAEKEEVNQFWFGKVGPRGWWRKDRKLDAKIADLFGACLRAARRGELYHWRDTPRGRLAEIVVLDQFSRHIHRGKPEAYAADEMALVLAQEAVRLGADRELKMDERAFLYMPYMHSESRLIHEEALRLYGGEYGGEALEKNLKHEIRHKEIIDRFGRYPHRNRILGRQSTEEEIEFLKQPGSSF